MFTKSKLIDDNGLFFESYNTTKYINLQHNKSIIMLFLIKLLIYEFTLESSLFITKTTKAYLKIQELNAKICGLYNGLRLIVIMMIEGYISFS